VAKRGKQKNDSRAEHNEVKWEMGPQNNNNNNNNNNNSNNNSINNNMPVHSLTIPIGIKQQTFLFDFHCSL